MLGLEEKLEELKQLYKSGLIDKDEYRDLREKAYVAYGKIPPILQSANSTQNTQHKQTTERTQPQRTFLESRTQPQRTYPTKNTQSTRTKGHTQPQQKKGKGCLIPYVVFVIASILIGLLQDCN